MEAENVFPIGRKLDALVAQVIFEEPFTADQKDWETCGYFGDERFGGGTNCPGCFYSASISHAWDVIEKMRQGGYHFNIGACDKGYFCAFWGTMPDGRRYTIPPVYEKEAHVAICKAALLVVLKGLNNDEEAFLRRAQDLWDNVK